MANKFETVGESFARLAAKRAAKLAAKHEVDALSTTNCAPIAPYAQPVSANPQWVGEFVVPLPAVAASVQGHPTESFVSAEADPDPSEPIVGTDATQDPTTDRSQHE